jgi:hypothetical protein
MLSPQRCESVRRRIQKLRKFMSKSAIYVT